MVVLSAAIVAKSKTLIARQFVEMSRLRVEGLLSAFQKLVDIGRDHTFIETETVRYVYQPMESLHLLLVTNKSSNILEDLETLRLLAKVVQDCCQVQVNEEMVLKHAFDIVFAFDEVISFGHRESVTLSQIKAYTEMDSHEEKLHKIIEQNKINEAKEIMKKKQMELKKMQKQQGAESSIDKTGFGSESSMSNNTSSPFQDSMSSPGMSNVSMVQESSPPWSAPRDDDSGMATFKPKSGPKRAMVLGKKKPGDGLLPPEPAAAEAAPEVRDEPEKVAPYNPLMDPVKVEIDEKITASLQLEGGLNGEATCNGQFQVTVLDVAKAGLACFKLAAQSNEFKYKVHPNLNKASHANNILEVKEASKAYRANAPAPLLKWQSKSSDEAFLPVTVSCWPTSTTDGTAIVLELELTDTNVALDEVIIRFPAAPSSRPQISNAEPGEAVYDTGTQQIFWQIPLLDKNESTGTLEFTASADSASLLPCTMQAVRRGQTMCPMDITGCYHQETNSEISFTCEKTSTYELSIG